MLPDQSWIDGKGGGMPTVIIVVSSVITHISGGLEEVMREGLDGGPRKGSDGLPNGAETAE